MKKRVIFALTTAILAVFIGGCSLFSVAPVSGTIELTDDFQRTIALDQPAERIISLAPATTEILYALGIGDRVVGATEYCNYPEAALAVTRVGGFGDPNLEMILDLEPDLVLASSQDKTAVEALEQMGIAVLALDPDSFEDIYANIELLAEATGTESEGQLLIQDMQARLQAVQDRISQADSPARPLVYYEVWYPEPMTAGRGTFIDVIITLAGGQNLASDLERYPIISTEVLFDRNPEIILHGHFDADPATFADRDGWSVITAVAEENIHYVDQDIFNRPGPRMADAVELLARLLHPGIYE